MALINCPECSREISDKADACPHCGFHVAKMPLQTKPEANSDIVHCLDCKKEFPFEDEVCPFCGLFNSQKYKDKNKPKEIPLAPFVWVSDKDGYTSIRCPNCSKISRVKNQFLTSTDTGLVTDDIGTCSCGQTFNQIKKEAVKSAKQIAKAWPRFFARTFDLWWGSLLIGFATAIFLALINPNFAVWINKPGSEALFGMLILPIVLFFDAALYAIAGNTPGKMLLGLKVTSSGGIPLEFGEYFSRNMSVWFSGLALGFPLINLFTMANQHKRLGRGEPASYDYEPNYKVQSKPLGGLQITAFVFLFICLIFVMGILKEIGKN